MASNRKFGISFDAGGLANGIVINSISRSSNTESAEARNHLGQLTDIAVYGSGEEITIDGLATSGGVKAGDIINLGGKTTIFLLCPQESIGQFQKIRGKEC